jgi:hypothetical protein
MSKKKQLLMAMLCAFSMMINSVAVVAQNKDKGQETKPVPEQGAWVTTLPAPAPPAGFIQREFSFGGPVVKDAPYSAEAVTETIQMLGDGNRIVQNSSSKIFRDGAGRTRHEQALKAIGPWAVSGESPVMISINDPVSGVHYNLNSNAKIAHKMAPLDKLALDEALKVKMKSKQKAADGAESGANVSNVSSYGVTESAGVRTVVSGSSSGATSVNTVTLTRAAPGAIVGMASAAPALPMAGAFFGAGEGEVSTESLGKQMIEGVEAEGQRVTITIQAGKIGNDRPIVTVNERWYSPELQTVVLSKNSDPRFGETTYKLINIDRSEPDSSLFQVPADYTVEEGPSFNFRAMPAEPPMIKKKRRPNEN